MTKIKICGLTQLQDAKWANALMPDYVGFVFAKSKRQLTAEDAAIITREIDPDIQKVGVFVNPTQEELDHILSVCPLDILQLHGEESPEFCTNQSQPVWKAFRMRSKEILGAIEEYPVDGLLLDGYHPKSHGGEGITFPWSWAKDVDTGGTPLILAGGLYEDNIEEAIHMLHPYAVDVSSAVETNGIKDPQKIERFIRKVRSIDEQS